MERENQNGAVVGEENGKKEMDEVNDLEKGEAVFGEKVIQSNDNNGDNHNDLGESHMSRFNRLNPTNPLRLVINTGTRVGTPATAPAPAPSQHSQPRSTPAPRQVSFFRRNKLFISVSFYAT